MNHTSARRGMTLIELLVALLVMTLVGTALFTLIKTSFDSRSSIQTSNQTYAVARQAIDTMADHIRNAQADPSQPLWAAAALSEATATSIAYFTEAGATVRYWFDTSTNPKTLKRTDGSGTTIVLSGMQSLQFTYYKNVGAFYTSSTDTPNNWPTTTAPQAPTSAEMSLIGAVGIQSAVTVGDTTRPIVTLVRLRNSPPALKKV